VIVVLFAFSLAVSSVSDLGEVTLPLSLLLLLLLASVGANVWLGAVLLQLRHHPSLQEHATGR